MTSFHNGIFLAPCDNMDNFQYNLTETIQQLSKDNTQFDAFFEKIQDQVKLNICNNSTA